MFKGVKLNVKNYKFGLILLKNGPEGHFESWIVVENDIFGNFQYKSLKSPYMKAIFKRK